MVFDHQAQESINEGGVRAGTGYGHIRDDPNVSISNNLHELHGCVTLGADSFGLISDCMDKDSKEVF